MVVSFGHTSMTVFVPDYEIQTVRQRKIIYFIGSIFKMKQGDIDSLFFGFLDIVLRRLQGYS